MDFSCASCGSDQFTKTSFVYEQGVVHGHSSSRGVGVGVVGGRIGVGFGSGNAHTTQVTSSALRAAPPKRRTAHGAVYFLIFFFGAPAIGLLFFGLSILLRDPSNGLSMILGGGFMAAMAWLPVHLIRSNAKYNKTIFPSRYLRWKRSFMCNRCGNIIEPVLSQPNGDTKAAINDDQPISIPEH